MMAKEKSTAKKQTRHKKKVIRRTSTVYVVLSVLGNLLLILLSLILLAVICAGIYATDYFMNVLGEIRTTDYSEPQQRIKEYEAYFDKLSKLDYLVVPSEPFIREGEIFYLWTATPPRASEPKVYRWKLSLETNDVTPLTPDAKQLDRELGF